MKVEATAKKCERLDHWVRVCSFMRNQVSWVSAVALSVCPACSLCM